MCGQFYVEVDDRDMAEILAAVAENSAVKTGTVYPTDKVAALAPGGELAAMRWGFSLGGGKGKGLVINARSETAAVKPMFRVPMRTGRCLLPASWYFEWEKRGRERVKYALRPPEPGVLWLAGLSHRDGDSGETRVVILTRPAWQGIAFIHDRMPVILDKTLHDEWLHGRDPERVVALARQEMRYAPVE